MASTETTTLAREADREDLAWWIVRLQEFIRHGGLSQRPTPNETRVLLVFMQNIDPHTGEGYPSISCMADDARISDRAAVMKALRGLSKKRMLVTVRTSKKGTAELPPSGRARGFK